MEVISFQDFIRSGRESKDVSQINSLSIKKEIPLDEAYDALMVILISFYLMYDY